MAVGDELNCGLVELVESLFEFPRVIVGHGSDIITIRTISKVASHHRIFSIKDSKRLQGAWMIGLGIFKAIRRYLYMVSLLLLIIQE